jgi:adenosylhomocysteine nucleosidase
VSRGPDQRRRAALLAPMWPELRPLIRPLALQADAHALWRGRYGGLEVVARVTGIGTAAAARAAERVLAEAAVEHLLVVGIAGGIGPSVGIGELVVPERVIDVASGEEHRPRDLGVAPARGGLATFDGLLLDAVELSRLEACGVIAIDMETAAIARVCERSGCPWSVLRGVSDRADDGSADPEILDLAGPEGRGNAAAVARFLLRRPARIPQLVRLAGGMRRATGAAANAALAALTRLEQGGAES